MEGVSVRWSSRTALYGQRLKSMKGGESRKRVSRSVIDL